MPHARETIRSAVVTAVTGLTTTSTRVYESRYLPLGPSLSPSLCVYTRLDTPDYSAGVMQDRPRRVLEVHVEGYCDGADQSVLDDMASEVEAAIFNNTALQGLVGSVSLGEQAMRVEGEGAELVSVIDMVFNITYSTAEGSPGTVLRG